MLQTYADFAPTGFDSRGLNAHRMGEDDDGESRTGPTSKRLKFNASPADNYIMQRTQQHGFKIAQTIVASFAKLADSAMVANIKLAFLALDDAQRFALRAYGIDSANGLVALAIGKTRNVNWKD